MIIGEFSRLTGISEYTLRYYEKKGLLHVERDGAGRRDYREADVEWVKFIKRLKDTGMLLRDIRHYSDLRYQGMKPWKRGWSCLYGTGGQWWKSRGNGRSIWIIWMIRLRFTGSGLTGEGDNRGAYGKRIVRFNI